MNLRAVVIIILAFMTGVVSTLALSSYLYPYEQVPSVTTTTYALNGESPEETSDGNFITRILDMSNEERPSPYDWVPEKKISVLKDKIIIEIEGAVWSRFTNTNSMDPVLDNGANAIQIIPRYEADIHVGDIVSYESEYSDGTIIHRVIDINYDDEGWYAVMKGDNNPRVDPGRVRFSQIKRVLVAVIY